MTLSGNVLFHTLSTFVTYIIQQYQLGHPYCLRLCYIRLIEVAGQEFQDQVNDPQDNFCMI